MKLRLSTFALILTISVVSDSAQAGESEFIKACEARIKSLVPVPAAFERLRAIEAVTLLTRDDVVRQVKSTGAPQEQISRMAKKYDAGTFRPIEATVVIDFKLPNSNGVLTDRRSVCEIRKQHIDEQIHPTLIVIDGMMLDATLREKFKR